MLLKNAMLKKSNTITMVVFLIICSVCVNVCIPAHAQSPEKKTIEVKLSEKNIIVKSEDVENARVKADEIKAGNDKSIRDAEAFVSNLEGDAETTAVFLDRLQQDKKDYQAGIPPFPEKEKINLKYLELLDKEIGAVKQKVDADYEQIQAFRDKLTALQNHTKAFADWVGLLESIVRLEETLVVTPPDQAVAIRKEADIAKGFIPAQQANLKEKESLVSFFTKELEDVKVRTSGKAQDIAKNLELLGTEINDGELVKKVQEKVTSIKLWHKAVNAQWITIFKTKLETAKIRYDLAVQALKNAELNAAFLAEKASRLEEKLKTEELRRKQADLEAAKKAEEVTQKVAEVTRAETEKTLQEAAKKGEEVIQMQRITTSPEKKRVLELEAEVHKQAGQVAKKKDELIIEGTQRYKDITEYKKLEADFDVLLSKADTAKELDEIQSKVDAEMKRFTEAASVIESLITSLKQEEKLMSDSLNKAYEEIPIIEKEVAAFEDKEQAALAIDYARQKAKLLDEQLGLIISRLDRLYERLEIKNNVQILLRERKERLLTEKAANVWLRRESSISVETFRSVYKDLTGCYGQLDQFYGVVQSQVKIVITYVTNKKYTIGFWVRLFGLSVLIAVYYLSQRYIQRFCQRKIQALYETVNLSYYKTRLLPSLLIVLQKSINAIWIAILAISISNIFNAETPWVAATIYVLTIIAVYKMLKGFVIESFGPEKGDKKLVTSLAYVSPKHLYKSLNIILKFSLVSLSIITVLAVFGYRSDVIELIWFVYRLVILILLLWIATQKTLIFNLLPSAESQLGRFIHRVIKVIYPIFIVFVVSLFAIRSLGYPVLTYSLLKTCIKSFVIAFIAFWIWKYLYYRLSNIREIRLKRSTVKKDTPEEKRYHAVTTIYLVLFNYAISIIAAIIIIRVWVKTFHYAVGSPAAPYLVQKVFLQIGAIFVAIGSGLRYRFVFEEGRYTTPIKIIVALVVLVVSFFIARYIKKLLEDRVFYKLRLERGLSQTFSTLVRYVIIGIAVLIGFRMAGIPLRSLAFFAGAFGIGIGFGMQNIISNFVSGIILLFERPMRVGDVITLDDGTLGTIDKISTRSTTITTPDNIVITVPNSKFVESRVTNWSLPNSIMRGSVKVGVAYGSDINLVKKCLLEVAKQNQNVRIYPEPFVRFDEFGDSALMFKLFYWADDPGKRWFAMSEMHFAIDEMFRKNKIEIAFPQRDIHIRSVVPFPIRDLPGSAGQDGDRKTDK